MSNENAQPNNKSLLKSGLLLSLMTFMSRIMGLLREMTKAAFLGTSMYADAFTTAFMIPNLLRRLFAENAVSAAFIPTFKKYLAKGDEQENRRQTQEFLKSTFTLVSFLTACIVVLGIAITPFITPIFCKKPIDPDNITLFVHFKMWLASNMPALFTPPVIPSAEDYAAQIQSWLSKKNEITALTRIMFPYLFVISIAAFFQGILNGCKIFAPSGFTPVLFNGIVIAGTYILSPFTENPARAMSFGVIVGGIVQALFQLPFVLKTKWSVCFTSLKKTFTNPGTKKVVALIVPTIIGMAAYQLNDLVSTAIASRTGDGIVSSLQYSIRLQELILGIFAVSIGTVILPDLSGLANSKRWEEFNNMLIQAIKIMTLISIPVTVYSLITGKELISLLYKSKKFDDESVRLTLGVFHFHISGLLFIALNRIISPAFYSQGNTKLPTLAGILSFGANIVLVFILSKFMGGKGIALGLTLASLINTIFLFAFMKKMKSMNIRRIAKSTIIYIIKICIYSAIAALPCIRLHPIIVRVFASYKRIIAFGMPVVLTAILFGTIGVVELIITKDEIIKAIFRKVKR